MAEIELICPGCGAGYALPASALPPAGREVECSRCTHVWRATPPAPEGPLDLAGFSRLAGAGPAARAPSDGDDEDRPAAIPLPPASKRLSPDLLDLLRDEVDRERRLRAAEAGDGAAKDAGDKMTGAKEPPDRQVPDPRTPGPEDNGISHPSGPDEIDWPATTVTLPAGTSRSMTPTAQPPVLLTPAPEPVLAPARGPTMPEPAPDPVPARPAPSAPNAAPAVARQAPQPGAARAASLRADASAPDRVPHPAIPSDRRPPKGPLRAYRLGLGLAVLLAAAVVAVYLLAPVVQPQDGWLAQTLSAWRSDLDLARLWLDAQLRRLIP